MPKLIELNGELLKSDEQSHPQTLNLTADIELSAEMLQGVELIEVSFSNFTDGRGYSTAKILRERFDWQGPIRAVGDITVDQLGYLARCGFDSFALRDDQDLGIAKSYLNAFSTGYQQGYARRA